jgi:hypothetical protein
VPGALGEEGLAAGAAGEAGFGAVFAGFGGFAFEGAGAGAAAFAGADVDPSPFPKGVAASVEGVAVFVAGVCAGEEIRAGTAGTGRAGAAVGGVSSDTSGSGPGRVASAGRDEGTTVITWNGLPGAGRRVISPRPSCPTALATAAGTGSSGGVAGSACVGAGFGWRGAGGSVVEPAGGEVGGWEAGGWETRGCETGGWETCGGGNPGCAARPVPSRPRRTSTARSPSSAVLQR